MSTQTKDKAGTGFHRLRDQFEGLARDFAAKPLRAVVTFEPRDERSPEEREEDSDYRAVRVWLVEVPDDRCRDPRLTALDMIAEEVEAAFEAEGERVGPGRTPAERWLLRVAHTRPWKHPLRHGEWEAATTWDETEETTVRIDDVFRASALAIDRIAEGGLNVREKAAEREDRAIALLREHRDDDDWTASRIAAEIGKHPSFLSRSERFKAEWAKLKGDPKPKAPPVCAHCRGEAKPFRCRKCDPERGVLVRGCCAECHAERVHNIVPPA